MVEDLSELQGPFHSLLQLLFGGLQCPDVLPLHVGLLDQDLPHGGGLHVLQCVLEVVLGDEDVVQHFPGNLLGLQVHVGYDTPECGHGGLLGQCGQVGSRVSVGLVGEPFQVDILRQRHSAGVDLQDLETSVPVGDTDLDLPVEPSGSPQGLVDGVGSVGGTDDHDLSPGVQTVHEAQELCDDTPLLLTVHLVTLGRDRVYLIDEDDAGCVLLCLLEDLPQLALGLTVELADDLRSSDGDEVAARLPGDGLGQHGLTGSGRSVEQHPFGSLDTQPLEEFRVSERQFDHLPDLPDGVSETSDIIVGYLGDVTLVGGGLVRDLHLGVGCHHHRVS